MNLLTNIIRNRLVRRFFILLLLLFLFVTISAFSYANNISSHISNTIFRLHVVANSDSMEDQNLKYIIRDKVLEYVNELSKGLTTREEVIALVTDNSNKIKEIAQEVINNNGYNYDVDVKIGNFAFPTKQYGDISLPAGMYDALRIEIGEAKRPKLVVCDVPSLMFY